MRVTLDIFSGTPNPAWELSEQQARQLMDRVAGRALPVAEAMDGVLGFRGFVVEADADDEAASAGSPESFRLGITAPAGYGALAGLALPTLQADDQREAARFLLETAGAAVHEAVKAIVDQTLRTGTVSELAEAEAEGTEAPLQAQAACVIHNTPYNPAFWNHPPVQAHNNCYNYAMNYRSDTYAQPGRISGRLRTAFTCANVGAAADSDGCRTTCQGSAKTVALVIWPGHDFHWYRLQSNGFWAHKPGGAPVRNVDNLGRVIRPPLFPHNCARGPYSDFCNYRFSPTGMRVS